MRSDALILGLLLLAAGAAPACSAESSTETESETNQDSSAAVQGGCNPMPMEAAVDWDVQTRFGNPAVMFGALEGECQADLVWGTEAAAPAAQTHVSVRVELDHASARIVHPGGSGGTGVCATFLQVAGAVDLRTADDRLLVVGAMTVIRTSGAPLPPAIHFMQMSREQPGLAIAVEPDERALLGYQLEGGIAACSGTLTLTRQVTRGNQSAAVSRGPGSFARWSKAP
jgi:hypothetical protein